MQPLRLLPLISAFILSFHVQGSLGIVYQLSETIWGNSWWDAFNWFNIPDYTNGRVNYVDRDTSRRLNLTYLTPQNNFVLRADSWTRLSPSGPGRNSVRISTKRSYRTHVAVFHINHVPEGCGTWPAIWETKENGWPNGGEIDIFEGVNDQVENLSAVHTSPSCTMPQNRNQQGSSVAHECHNHSAGGCNVRAPSHLPSYGSRLNQVGGGWYALERQPNYLKVYFWPRNAGNIPNDILNPGNSVDPSRWGTPIALFESNSGCDINSKFSDNNIIINLTFCGDWAGDGGQYPWSTCPGSCIDYVNNNPGAFANAYFEFPWIKIYQ